MNLLCLTTWLPSYRHKTFSTQIFRKLLILSRPRSEPASARWCQRLGEPGGEVVSSKMTSMSHNVFKIRPQAAVWQCDRMPSQTQRISGAPHSCYGAASYGHYYLFAPVRHVPVSRHARHVERSSPVR